MFKNILFFLSVSYLLLGVPHLLCATAYADLTETVVQPPQTTNTHEIIVLPDNISSLSSSRSDITGNESLVLEHLKHTLYGGTQADHIFQYNAKRVPWYTRYNMISGRQSFMQLLEAAMKTRAQIAVLSNTPNPESFGNLRNINNGLGSITPVFQYLTMLKNLQHNITSLAPSEHFQSLDEDFDYRIREYTVYEWQKIIAQDPQIDKRNAMNAYLNRLIDGPHNTGDVSSLLFNLDNVMLNEQGQKVLVVNNRLQKALLHAKSQAACAINDDNVKIGHIELRIKGTHVVTRGFLYVTDALTTCDKPFALQHPPASAVNYHLAQCQRYFEEAHYARHEGNTQEIIEKINRFSYWFAITMPTLRGSAAINEWLTTALFLFHDLDLPVMEKRDELAQGSFTFAQYQEALRREGGDQLSPPTFTFHDFKQSVMQNISLNDFLMNIDFLHKTPDTVIHRPLTNTIRTVLVVAPPQVTGGPETLSFFASTAQNLGFDTYMVWWQGQSFVNREQKPNGLTYLKYTPDKDYTPEQYKNHYHIKQLQHDVILDDSVLVVIPEIITNAESFFKPARRAISWLSLGNFTGRNENRIFEKLINDNKLNTLDCHHIVDTQWIEKKLSSWGVESYPAYCPISDLYRNTFVTPKINQSIAYAPRKGGENAKKFKTLHPTYHYVEINGMTENQVFQAFLSTKIFIDFGHFPGCDRMPREALLSNCVILIHNMGCAQDHDSFPLDDFFRFDSADIDNGVLASKVDDILANYEEMQIRQRPFRDIIMNEPHHFRQQVAALLGTPRP